MPALLAVGGVLALLVGADGLSVFEATGLVGGSGLLAVHRFGLVVANRAREAVVASGDMFAGSRAGADAMVTRGLRARGLRRP